MSRKLCKYFTVHNYYNQHGGEEVVFEAETKLLRENGNTVDTLVFDNLNAKSFTGSILTGLRLMYNPVSAAKMKQKIREFKPDVIHVHNFIAEASPSIFYAAFKFQIPIVVTLHNFRLVCPSGHLSFKNKIYEKSLSAYLPRILSNHIEVQISPTSLTTRNG